MAACRATASGAAMRVDDPEDARSCNAPAGRTTRPARAFVHCGTRSQRPARSTRRTRVHRDGSHGTGRHSRPARPSPAAPLPARRCDGSSTRRGAASEVRDADPRSAAMPPEPVVIPRGAFAPRRRPPTRRRRPRISLHLAPTATPPPADDAPVTPRPLPSGILIVLALAAIGVLGIARRLGATASTARPSRRARTAAHRPAAGARSRRRRRVPPSPSRASENGTRRTRAHGVHARRAGRDASPAAEPPRPAASTPPRAPAPKAGMHRHRRLRPRNRAPKAAPAPPRPAAEPIAGAVTTTCSTSTQGLRRFASCATACATAAKASWGKVAQCPGAPSADHGDLPTSVSGAPIVVPTPSSLRSGPRGIAPYARARAAGATTITTIVAGIFETEAAADQACARASRPPTSTVSW